MPSKHTVAFLQNQYLYVLHWLRMDIWLMEYRWIEWSHPVSVSDKKLELDVYIVCLW